MPIGLSAALGLRQMATPAAAAPASTTLLYTKSDGLLYRKVGSVESPVDTTGGAAYTPSAVTEMNSSSTSNVPTATWTTVAGWSGMGGYISGFTSGVATFAVAGMYLFIGTATISTSGSSTGRRMIGFWKNGSEIRRQDYSNAPAGPTTLYLTTMIPMAVNDTAQLVVFQASGSGLALNVSPGHKWTIWRMSGDSAFA